MSAKDVFISYKAEEFEEANWVKTILEENGITCWMAPMSINGGKSYASEIPKAIRECTAFVLILSKNAQESKWVPRELDQAINESKVILPFMLENCALKDDFNFYLTNVQRYAAYESKRNAIEKMIRELKAIIGAHNEKEDTAEQIARTETGTAEKYSFLETADENAGSSNLTDDTGDAAESGFLTESPDDADASGNLMEDPDGTEESGNPAADETESAKISDSSGNAKKRRPGNEKNRKKKSPIKRIGIILGCLAAAIAVAFGITRIADKLNKTVIAGEEIYKDVTSLYISDEDLTAEDVNNIKKLKNLHTLQFENCPQIGEQLGEILGDPNMYDLECIRVKNCGLTDEQLKSVDFAKIDLETLDLSNNSLTDLSVLTELADNLCNLNFDGNGVTDITFLSDLTELTVLSAANNGIEDVSALASLTGITGLYLDGNNLQSLDFLSSYQNLENLSVNNTGLSSLKGIEQNIKLETIYAGDNSLTSLEGLENATILKSVYLNNNRIADISLLGKSAATLERLYVNNNQITNVDVLTGCTGLKFLSADNNLLTELSALSSCSNLREISVSDNVITSIRGLECAAELFYIDLSNNQIKDGSEIMDLSLGTSVKLILSNNNMVITGIPTADYSFIDLHGNTINSDEVFLGIVDGWKMVIDYSEDIDLAYLMETGSSDFYLIDCPLDKRLEVKGVLGEHSTHFITEEETAEYKEEFISDNIRGTAD